MNKERIMKIILGPHVSEKTSMAGQYSQYAFKVMRDATKNEIKRAVEMFFNVKVDSVNVVNVKGKKTRFKKTQGVHKSWKKAYVKLKEGSTINFAGVEG